MFMLFSIYYQSKNMLGVFRSETYNISMKRIWIAVLITCVLIVSLSAGSNAAMIRRTMVPRVAYLEPANDVSIDLTGQKTLTFRWKQQPIPSGGREGFRFRLYKGFDYELIVKEELGADVLSIDVPADKFEDGATYSWHVEQYDSSYLLWSLHDRWSFRVTKK
jgi:hypothetical protein